MRRPVQFTLRSAFAVLTFMIVAIVFAPKLWNVRLTAPPRIDVRNPGSLDLAGERIRFPVKRGSVNGLLRWLVAHQVKLPVRPHFGVHRGELQWRLPNRVTLLNMLHHPIYAGAYRWGHRQVDLRKKRAGRPGTGRTLQAYDAYRVLIRERFPAYIAWEEFEENQRKLAENSTLGKALSAPRHGPSILAGLVERGMSGVLRRVKLRRDGRLFRIALDDI